MVRNTRLLRVGTVWAAIVAIGLAICIRPAQSQTPPQVAQAVVADSFAAVESKPAEEDGLAVVIKPIKRSFMPNEPLALDVTFRNVSTAAFRLPNTPALFGEWMLRAENVTTGKTYTGGIFVSGGEALTTVSPSDPIAPDGELSLSVTFQDQLSLVEGALDYDAFQKAAGGALAKVPNPAQVISDTNLPPGLFVELPTGVYKISLTIRFPYAAMTDNDSIPPGPLWKDGVITTNAVEINEGIFSPGENGAISGTVLEANGQPAVHAPITCCTASEFTYNTPPIPGSREAYDISRSPLLPPNPTLLAPPARYYKPRRGSISAGFTDDKGAFTIKALPPNTYVVIVSRLLVTRTNQQYGSIQPVEVKQGERTDLPNPIRLVREPIAN